MPKLTTAAVAKYVAAANARREIRDALSPGLYLIIQPKPKGTSPGQCASAARTVNRQS